MQGNNDLRCSVTPKVHMMVKHVGWQMGNLKGGLGDKMEDWVQCLHQTGIRQRQQFQTVQNPLVRAIAREKANSRVTHPDVIAQTDTVDEGNKRNLSEKNDPVGSQRKRQRDVGRKQSLQYFEENRDTTLTWLALLFVDSNEGGEDGLFEETA